MRRYAIILMIPLAASVAVAEITASLKVLAGQDAAAGPYRRAELTVTNSADAATETILLRPAGVGLTVRYWLTVPPGATGRRIVELPAVSPVQEYALTVLDDSGNVVGAAKASITWPAELVGADAFIDDAFEPWTDDVARWSAKTRRTCLLVLATFITAAAAVLFVRRPILRAVSVLAVAGAAAAMLFFVFIPTGPEAVQDHRYALLLHDGAGGFESDSFAVLLSARTTEWSLRTSPLPHPVWPDRNAAANDEILVNPEAGAVELTIRPGQVRIIRPAWGDRFPEETATRLGSVRRETDSLIVETNLNWFSSRLLLICDDSVWRFDSSAGSSKETIRTEKMQSWSAFLSGEGGRILDRHTRRLLTYWRSKHRRTGQVYLLEPSGSETRTRIEVVKLREKPKIPATQEISND